LGQDKTKLSCLVRVGGVNKLLQTVVYYAAMSWRVQT